MTAWIMTWRALWDEDALAAYRDRIALHLSAFSAVLLLPFTLHHLAAGRVLLGAVILVAQGVLLVNGLTLRAGRLAPVPFWIMVMAFNSAIVAAILVQGIHSAFWIFPAMFVCYFLLERRLALVLSCVLLVAASTAAWKVAGPNGGTRVIASAVLTMVMINVVLNVIGELQRTLMRQATTDPLTGARNRRHLDEQLARLGAATARGRVDTLLAIDIDHFKAINDRHGHGVGDAVLKALVALVHERVRQDDELFRVGGEEFVLLLPRTPPDDARKVAEGLRRHIEASELLPGLRITVSIGVSIRTPHGAFDPARWLAAADAALYEAKHGGRNRVVLAPLPG